MHTWIANPKINKRVYSLDASFIIIPVYFSIVVGQFSLNNLRFATIDLCINRDPDRVS